MSKINGYKVHETFLLLGGVVMKDQMEEKAKRAIQFVFDMHVKMRLKCGRTIANLTFIQNRFKKRAETREAKLEILVNAWIKLVN